MRLLTGPAGSGKTFRVHESLRAALRRNDGGVRLLVPTATMAQHLRNEMAREGFVFSPALIQTLSRFIDPWAADLPQVSAPVLHMLLENSVHRLHLPEFAKVAHIAGFHARLAAAIEECDAAGCDAAALERHLPRAGLGHALAAVYAEVNRALEARKLGMRSTRLHRAATRIDQQGIAVRSVWLDGFFSLTESELAVVKALARHADVTVTLPSDAIAADTRVRLISLGFEETRLSRDRVPPKRELFTAPGIEREADEIARRILAEVAGGRSFHEIGIILRTPDAYAGLLRATLERFGIPARFYFDSVLLEQPAVRFLAGVVDAMLGGWDHGQTLVAMKLAPGAGISAPMDRFDFEVRKKLPGIGLETLRDLATGIQSQDQRLRRLLERMSELEAWRPLLLTPAEWAQRFTQLRAFYRPGQPRDGVSHETAIEWRSQARALDAFEAAALEAASMLAPASRLSLTDCWKAMKTALRLTPLRVADQRRNVVHVLSAYEARQWELPVVFVCGLVEGQFPRYQPPDPFLPEPARRRLQEGGLRIRSAEDREREEQFLFDSALSRATALVVLSYPKNDARGEQNLPSLFLDPAAPAATNLPIRLLLPETSPAAPWGGIRAADLLPVLAQKHAEVRPTALESFLQCPFQFFARHTLALEGAPPRPEERLDFLARGIIVHRVIAEWLAMRGQIDGIFERTFHEVTKEESIPAGYKTELIRAKMLEDLRRFALSDSWPAEWEGSGEIAARFELDGGLVIRCRIDRLMKAPDGRAFVIDYKYSLSAKDKLTNQNLLQGPLYWLAAERAFHSRTTGMLYCSLRAGIEYAGWGEKPDFLEKAAVVPFAQEWLDGAVERSRRAAQQISTGRVAPAPSDVSLCGRCDFKDVCRYDGATAAVAEGA